MRVTTPNTPTPYPELVDDPPVFPSGHLYDLVKEADRPRVDGEGYIGFTAKQGLGFEWDFEVLKRFKVVAETR